jgi:hypothetical protein
VTELGNGEDVHQVEEQLDHADLGMFAAVAKP